MRRWGREARLAKDRGLMEAPHLDEQYLKSGGWSEKVKQLIMSKTLARRKDGTTELYAYELVKDPQKMAEFYSGALSTSAVRQVFTGLASPRESSHASASKPLGTHRIDYIQRQFGYFLSFPQVSNAAILNAATNAVIADHLLQ